MNLLKSDNTEEIEREQEFLKQFPAMSSLYKNIEDIKKKNRKRMRGNQEYDVRSGGWNLPTCCSLFVNFIQFCLTLTTILLNKGDSSAYWIPSLI
jgi:hypothetical protein